MRPPVKAICFDGQHTAKLIIWATRQLMGNEGYPWEVILEMMREFGDRNGRIGEMQWALQEAAKFL
jgi:hypothetical protein